MAKTKDFGKVLRQQLAADPKLRDDVDEAMFNAAVAVLIHKARREAGLTQKQLADAIGSHQPVIARLEDADYDGHSLAIVRKIARALGKRLKPLEFESIADEASEEQDISVEWTAQPQWRPTYNLPANSIAGAV